MIKVSFICIHTQSIASFCKVYLKIQSVHGEINMIDWQEVIDVKPQKDSEGAKHIFHLFCLVKSISLSLLRQVRHQHTDQTDNLASMQTESFSLYRNGQVEKNKAPCVPPTTSALYTYTQYLTLLFKFSIQLASE